MELSLTELCLRSTIEPQYGYPDIAATVQESNRHIGNLLTAARSYIDQVLQDFKMVLLSPSFGKSAKALLSAEYDRSLEYRFMEALRNYTQHRAFPATGFSGSWVLDDDPNAWAENLTISADKRNVFEDEKFKTKFLDGLPERVDLRRYCREYVRGLGNAHMAMRKLVEPAVTQSRALIDDTILKYEGSDNHPTVGLTARKLGEAPEDVAILTNWDDVRTMLVQKNCRPVDLWPRNRPGELSGADLKALREKAGHTVEQAAQSVFVPPARWEQFEAGLRIPKAIHHLYMLQTGLHPTYDTIRRGATTAGQRQDPEGVPTQNGSL